MARKRAVTSGRRGRRSGRATAPRADQANVATYEALEMSLPASSPASSPPKRKPRKAAPRGKWSEEHLLTSDESVLIDADLVKLLARPEAWDILEDHEKREILALLPADTHPASELAPDGPDTKIPPLPESFVRYSNNWRDGVRQFQLDLQNGRFDPEWLRQAEVARRKREKGDFDSFKEREFEKFWGQKQRTSDATMSGESSKVKLTQLIEAGVFLVGDVWRFGYVYGKGPDRISIDKEVRIHKINDRKLTFIVPTGQRVFLRSHTIAADPKPEPGQTDGHEVKEAQTTEVLMADPPEPGTLKEEPPVNDNPKKEERQPDVGLRDIDQDPKLEDIEAESKQEEDLVNDEALEVPAGPEGDPHNQNNQNGPVQVVIVSPRPELDADQKAFKRPTPLPAVEPPAKRKRGRPRKTRLASPELRAESDSEPETEAVPAQAQQLELQRESGVQVVIGVDSSALLRAELLSQIELPAPSPGMARLFSTKHDAMGLAHTPRKAEPEPATNEPTSSPLSPALSIRQSSPVSETNEWFKDNHTEKTIKEHTEQRTEQPPDEPIEVPNEELTKMPGHERTEEHIERPIEVPSEESNEVPTEMPIEAPAEVSAQENIEMHTSEHIGTPVEEHVEEHVEEPVDGPTRTPPGAQPTTDDQDEIIVPDISSPMVLVKLILQIDGRRPDGRTANSWKEIRCYRKNQDMGSLFDVRQAWYLKQK